MLSLMYCTCSPTSSPVVWTVSMSILLEANISLPFSSSEALHGPALTVPLECTRQFKTLYHKNVYTAHSLPYFSSHLDFIKIIKTVAMQGMKLVPELPINRECSAAYVFRELS